MKQGDISNNNRLATKILVRAGMQYHKGRYCILAAAAALGILVLCTVFSIAFGKVKAEYLQSVRGAGTAATTYLEGGSMEQYHAIEALDYIRYVGREKSVGGASREETYVAALSAVDSAAWNQLLKPAYTHIQGHYPEKAEEIMLSFRALKTLGIQNPKEGMKLELTVFLGNRETQEEFALCGWYQEYREPSVFPPNGYVSQEKLKAWGMSLDEPDRLLLQQKDLLDGYAVEEKLYRDIPTLNSAQQFLGENTFLYSIMEEFTGGFYMAAFCGMLVLLVIFFLIQNVLGISMQKDIRQIGLLDTLGATQKQLRRVYFCQSGIALLAGSAVGLGASFLTVFFVVPKILGNLYLYHFGKAADLLVFHPEIFAFSLLFTTLVILGASVRTVHKATALSPLEAFHYLEMDRKAPEGSRKLLGKKKAPKNKEVPERKRAPGSGRRRTAGGEIRYMAWQNLLRYKRRFFFTIISLFLGFVTALGSVVLAAGTDQTHAIEKKPDFKIGGSNIESNYYREFSPVRESVKEKLLSVDGIQKDTVKVQRGDFLVVDNQEEAFRPLLDAYRSDEEEMLSDETKGEPPVLPDTATIQIAEDSYIEQLEAYVTEKSLKADIQALREGTGVLLLHHHELSPTLLKEADKRIGFPVSFWKIPIKTEEEWKERKEKSFSELWTEPAQSYEKAGELKLAGYLDTQAKGFPKLDMTWHGEGIKYFLISEAGFQKLLASEKTFGIQYYVDRQKEPSINITVQQILQEENRREPGLEDDLYVHCKSDELESAQGYIKTNRIIMGALSGVLLLVGIANYLNVIVTGMAARKKEFAVMESVGMTGRQMKGMLIAEGALYGGILTLLVFTAGTGILQLLHRYMDSRIAYFKFVYPWGTVLLLLTVLLGICLGVPVLFYKKTDMADIHTL